MTTLDVPHNSPEAEVGLLETERMTEVLVSIFSEFAGDKSEVWTAINQLQQEAYEKGRKSVTNPDRIDEIVAEVSEQVKLQEAIGIIRTDGNKINFITRLIVDRMLDKERGES